MWQPFPGQHSQNSPDGVIVKELLNAHDEPGMALPREGYPEDRTPELGLRPAGGQQALLDFLQQ